MRNYTLLIAVALFFPFTCFAAISGRSPAGRDSLPLLNRTAPEFRLKDLDGKIVSLSDFKGKTVVLDFWATWCVPCQQSFPGLKKTADHFAGGNDVVFVLIDTRESSPDHERLVKKQMEKFPNTFRVIFDEAGPAGLQNKQYLIYGMPGIPTKFIIDSKGIIRYQMIGYAPKQSDEENAAELIRYVEHARAIGRKPN